MGLQKAVLAPNEVKVRHTHTELEVVYMLDGEIIITMMGSLKSE